MSSQSCYRYKTPALSGPWRQRPDRALDDAIRARQAMRDESGAVWWRVTGTIEQSNCKSDAPCGGIYPAE
jgi:hypothetical protein